VQDDVNGEDLYKPQKGAMSKEKAAQLGAQYLWEIFGESIDGKAVRMVYLVGQPAYTKDLWIGNVFNTADEAAIPYFSSEKNNNPLLSFRIDAKTGEWVGIGRRQPTQQRGKVVKTVTFEDEIAMMKQPPAGLDEYIKIAKAFAQKHFTKTKVVDAEYDFQAFQTDEKTGLGDGDTRDIYEKGGLVIIAVTDDTGRVAEVRVDKDTKQAYLLDTSKSDKT
jgi:hypothetical protein